MTFERTYIADKINKLLNSACVFPRVAVRGQGELDLTPILEDKRNVLISDDTGGILFGYLGRNKYEAHPQFVKGTPYKDILAKSQLALNYMFKKTNCESIVANSPKPFRHSAFLALKMGFVHNDTLKKAHTFITGKTVDLEQYLLTKDRWGKRCQQEQC